MRKNTPPSNLFAQLRRRASVAEDGTPQEGFAFAFALVKARGDASMTQQEVADAMGTTQAVVARLESGKVLPSTRTLERFARATNTRLAISFEPERNPHYTSPRRSSRT